MTVSDDLLTACDREPIRIPGAIQPHGVLLVLDPDTLALRQSAGDVAGRLGLSEWLGKPVASILSDEGTQALQRFARSDEGSAFVVQWRAPSGELFDVSAHRVIGSILVEFEPGPERTHSSASLLAELERAANDFARAPTLRSLCERAVVEFRRLTGFDRVMVYRFIESEAGVVLAEDRAPELPGFLNHHFPGSDIPRQARELYVRNLTRVIPDVGYVPAPVEPPVAEPIDMSDCALRSVSPLHIQYLRNMGVQASASVSIVVDDGLWGLVACHNQTPKRISYEMRAACRALAAALARQIKSIEAAELFRERIRLRAFEDELAGAIARLEATSLELGSEADQLQGYVDADGVAILRGRRCVRAGKCPADEQIRTLADWILGHASPGETFSTNQLGSLYPKAAAFAPDATGVTAITLAADEPFMVLWFRSEAVEVVRWAGNPHEAERLTEAGTLTPRASFAAWAEEVRGQSRRWTLGQLESVGRLRKQIQDLRQAKRLREVNAQLAQTLSEKDLLLSRNEVLLGEVNHRVQNSLTLVSSFLRLQRRDSADRNLHAALEEAEQRVNAISLVHRRLYRGDQVEVVDLDRYLTEMRDEMVRSMGSEWDSHLTLDATPTIVPTDKAVSLGLIVTELVINANKYAYDGARGPIEIALREDRSDIRLSVSDRGRGTKKPSGGFGTRMMDSLVRQLKGNLEYHDNRPGLRVVLTAPVQ